MDNESERLMRKIANALAEIESDLSAIKESQTKASKEAAATKQASGDTEPTIVKVVEGVENRKSSSDKKDEADYQDRTLFWQKVTFFALLRYAFITLLIWWANNKAANAAKCAADAATLEANTSKQAFDMERRRAEDQEEAICRIHSDGMSAFDHIEHIYIGNTGKVKARNIEAHITISLNDAVTEKKVKELGSTDVVSSELDGNGQSLNRQVRLSLTDRDWKGIAGTNVIIINSGRVRYENGFGRIVDEPYCEGWWYFRTPEDKLNPVQGRGSECAQIPANVEGIRKQKAKQSNNPHD